MKYMRLLLFLVLIAFYIPSVNAAVQVMASNIYHNDGNDTDLSVTVFSVLYPTFSSNLSNSFSPLINGTGTYNVTIQVNQSQNSITSYWRAYKNGIYLDEMLPCSYPNVCILNITVSGVFNTTDIFTLRGSTDHGSAELHSIIESFRLMYDYGYEINPDAVASQNLGVTKPYTWGVNETITNLTPVPYGGYNDLEILRQSPNNYHTLWEFDEDTVTNTIWSKNITTNWTGTYSGGAINRTWTSWGAGITFNNATNDQITFTSTNISENNVTFLGRMKVFSWDETKNTPRILLLPGTVIMLRSGANSLMPATLQFQQTYTTTAGIWMSQNNSIPLNTWINWSVSYNFSSKVTPIIIINGVQQTVQIYQSPVGSMVTNIGTSYIGNNNVNRPFHGIIESLSIYEGYLNSSEISSHFNNPTWSSGELRTPIYDAGSYDKAAGVCFNGAFPLNTNASIYINSSADNSTWTGETEVLTNITTLRCLGLNSTNKQRYYKYNVTLYSNGTVTPRLDYLQTYILPVHKFLIPSFPVDNDPFTLAGAVQDFKVNLTSNSTVKWYINGTLVQTNTSVTKANYTNSSVTLGIWNISAIATANEVDITHTWIWYVYSAGNKSVSGYIKDQNGTIISGATILSKDVSTTSNGAGYYEFNVSSGKYNIVAGKSSFAANGTYELNYGNISNVNLTLMPSLVVDSNVFYADAQLMFNRFIALTDSSGHLTSDFDSTQLYYAEPELAAIGAILYSSGTNQTAQHLYNTLLVTQHVNRDMIRSDNMHGINQSIHIAEGLTNGISQFTEFNLAFFIQTIQRLEQNVSNTYNVDWNYTLNNFDPELQYVFTNIGTTETGDIMNWGMLQAYSEYYRCINGNDDTACDRVDTIVSKFISQINYNGYFSRAESVPTTTYSVFGTYGSHELANLGYTSTAFDAALNRSDEFLKSIQLKDGEWITAGRTAGHTWNLGQAVVVAFMQSTNKGDWYRRADLAYSKLQQYQYDSGSFYITRNNYDPSLRIGYMYYSQWSCYNLLTGFYLARSGELYDSLVSETEVTFTNFEDFNKDYDRDDISDSGFILLNSGKYSIYTHADAYQQYIMQYEFNNTGAVPLRFIITCTDCENVSILPNPHVTVGYNSSTYNFNYEFDYWNGNRLDISSYNRSNVTYNVSGNLIWVNITGLTYNGNYVGYTNISATVDGDLIHFTKTVGNYNESVLTSPRHKIDTLLSDGLTNSNKVISGLNMTWTHGKQTLEITNATDNTGALQLLASTFEGYGSFGLANATLFQSNSNAQDPYILSYDINLSTTNVYGYSITAVPPASVTNNQTTTGNFWINNTWNEPADVDFNHTMFKYVNETVIQNVSAGTEFLNRTLSPHYVQNISAQTVDTNENINQTKVWFNVTIANNLPILGSIGNINVAEGDTIDFTMVTTDADSDIITNTSNATEGTFTAATGNYNWVTSAGDAGTYIWNFSVSDGYGGSDIEVITVTVSDGEYIPPTPITLTNPSGNFWVNYTWSAGSGNVTNSYNITQNGTWSNGTVEAYKNTTVSPHGWSNITVYAYNMSDNGTLNFTGISMNTQVANNLPLLNAIGPKSLGAGELLDFELNSVDIDSDDKIYSTNASLGVLNPETGQFTLQTNASIIGVYSWNYSVSDGFGGTDFEIVTVTISEIPSPPNITSYSPQTPNTTQDGQTALFNVTVNQTVNITWYINGTLKQTNASTSIASYANSSTVAGSWNVTALASNDNGTDSQTWLWTVELPPVNPGPLITDYAPGSPNTTQDGQTALFNVTVNQTVNITWYINGTLKQTNASTMISSYANSSTVAGTWNVTAIASNDNGTDSQTWLWTVEPPPVNPAPGIISWSNDNTTDQNLTLSIPRYTTVIFMAESNQTMDNWDWTGSTEINGSGSNLSYSNKNFTSIGDFQVTFTCTNENGSCGNTKTWYINVYGIGGITVSGNITNILGIGLDSTRIDLGDSFTFTDSNGSYELSNLDEGSYNLVVQSIGYDSITIPLNLQDDEVLDYELEETSKSLLGDLSMIASAIILIFLVYISLKSANIFISACAFFYSMWYLSTQIDHTLAYAYMQTGAFYILWVAMGWNLTTKHLLRS